MFLLLQILHLVLFKSLRRQGKLSIYGNNRVAFWWARDGNRRLSFLRRADLPFFQNGFVATYFWPFFDRQLRKVILLVLQPCGEDCVVIGGRSIPFEISGCTTDLVDGAEWKCKRKRWFVFYAFLWTCRETDYFRLSCELAGWLTIAKSQALEIVYSVHAGALKGVVVEGESVSWGGAQTKGEVHKHELAKKMFLHSDLLTSLSSSLTQLCFTIGKLALRGNGEKDREVLTNQIVLYTRLTYVKPYQNILEQFGTNLKLWRI